MNPDKLTKEEEALMESVKGFVLSAEEKSEIRQRISSHIETKPIVKTRMYNSSILFGLLNMRPMYMMPIVLILLVSAGFGTGLVADKSLPGNALYPIKINVNENLESLLAISPEAQADLDLKQVSMRLDEVEKVEGLSNLSETQSLAIQSNFSKKVESLNKSIEKVRSKGNSKKADKINKDFDKEIDEHFDAFVAISNSASNSPTFSKILALRQGKNTGDGVFALSAKVSDRDDRDDKDDEYEDDDEDEDEDEDDDDSSIATTMTMTDPSVPPTATTTTFTKYTLTQVSSHKTATDCWSVVSGGVYNLTKWIAKHPGGEAAIKGMCGVDATKAFIAQHNGNKKAVETIKTYKIGEIK